MLELKCITNLEFVFTVVDSFPTIDGRPGVESQELEEHMSRRSMFHDESNDDNPRSKLYKDEIYDRVTCLLSLIGSTKLRFSALLLFYSRTSQDRKD